MQKNIRNYLEQCGDTDINPWRMDYIMRMKKLQGPVRIFGNTKIQKDKLLTISASARHHQ